MAKHEDDRPTVGSGATATDRGLGPVDPNVTQAEAGAAGGAAGVASGAMIGTVIGGPPGTIVGAVAGALGGWWAGHGAAHAAKNISEDDERYYRSHYDSTAGRLADRTYEHARPVYHFGYLAAEHPEYRGREFDAIEADLQKGWTDDLRLKYGEWTTVRGYAREGWSRRRLSADAPREGEEGLGNFELQETPEISTAPAGGAGSWGEHMEGQPAGRVDPSVGANMGGSPSHQRPSFSDPVAAVADDVAGGVDPDARVERIADVSGSPGWMAQPVDVPPGTRDAGAEARTGAAEDTDAARRRSDRPVSDEPPPHRRRADAAAVAESADTAPAPDDAASASVAEPPHRRRTDGADEARG